MTAASLITVWLLVSRARNAHLLAALDHSVFLVLENWAADSEPPRVDLVIWEPAAAGGAAAEIQRLPRPIGVIALGSVPIDCTLPIARLLPIEASASEIAQTCLWLGELVRLHRRLNAALRGRRRWRRRALTDPLTRLPNRRAWDQRVATWMAQDPAATQQRVLAILDLDGFKQVNDQWGHHRGDLVLQAVALVLRRACRDTDFVARLGGDEFGLLLAAKDSAEMSAKLARIHRELARLLVEQDLPPVTVSIGGVAIGAVVAPCAAAAIDSISQLLQAADRGLREVKVAGGNGSRLLDLSPGTV